MPKNEIKKTPVEQLQMDAAPAAVPEVPVPAAPSPAAPSPAAPANRQLTYAEKVQGLTANERIWTLAKSKAVAMATAMGVNSTATVALDRMSVPNSVTP